MLLVCPSCRTRYVVPDTAIGMDGRQVRCANCKHSWFQNGNIPDVAPAPMVVAPPVSAPAVPVPPAPVTAEPEPRPISDAPEPSISAAYASFEAPHVPDPVPVFAEPPVQTTYVHNEASVSQSQFAHEPPFRPRRNPARLWTIAAVAFALVIATAGTAFWYFGLPKNVFGLAGQEPDLKIVLSDNLELNERADGTPYFIASGSIVNPTGKSVRVPEMLVTLKDASGRAVYSWKMRAKVGSLAPGAKVDFSEARLDVPLAATQISIGWVLDNG
jgi:predicted Zn finger-like uncharacterized protein